MVKAQGGSIEYDQLKASGLSDGDIHMLRNSGASHRAILLWAKENRIPVSGDQGANPSRPSPNHRRVPSDSQLQGRPLARRTYSR